MKIRCFRTHSIVILLCAAALISACATSGTQGREVSAVAIARLKPTVEELLLNVKALEEIYQLLHASAQGYAFFGDDRQLDYLQKSALFVQDALQEARHQWEMLSIVDDIKDGALRDYFTLRNKGLSAALADLQFDISLIELYAPFLTKAEARNDVENALEAMRAIQANYNDLLTTVQPLVNAPETKAELLIRPKLQPEGIQRRSS